MQELAQIKTPIDVINEIELAMQNYPEPDCPLVHEFTPNMYIRQISMPAGSLITSKWHKTEHPFNISQGAVSVLLIENGLIVNETYLEAPCRGITKAGTRRLLYIHDDTVWTTYHYNPDNETDTDKIEERIIEKHINPLLDKNCMDEIASIYKRRTLEFQSLINKLKPE